MKYIQEYADAIWNLKFVKGYRTQIAKALIAGLSAYNLISLSPVIVQGVQVVDLSRLPDIPATWLAGILVYLAHKVDQFAKEHKPA